MTNSIRIILPFDTWQVLEETLLEALPETPDLTAEVIIIPPPSSPNSCGGGIDEEYLYSKLKSMQARLQSRYPYLNFNYVNMSAMAANDEMKGQTGAINPLYVSSQPAL